MALQVTDSYNTSRLAQNSKLLTSEVFLDMPLWLLQTKNTLNSTASCLATLLANYVLCYTH